MPLGLNELTHCPLVIQQCNVSCQLWFKQWLNVLTHWDRVMHICLSKLTIIGSENGLSPGQHQGIIWTNAGILLIGLLGTKFSEILIDIYKFSFKKMQLEMSSGKWWPFCLGLSVLTLNVWGPSYLGLTRSISWLLMPWLLNIARTPAAMILTMWNM